MVLNDTLANALSMIAQYEQLGRKEVIVRPSSKIIKAVLDVLHREGYVGSYEEAGAGRDKHLKVNLIGQVNRCGAIKPRFPISLDEFEKREKQYLPAKGFGVLVLSTPRGIITHAEAQQKRTGGQLLAYCY